MEPFTIYHNIRPELGQVHLLVRLQGVFDTGCWHSNLHAGQAVRHRRLPCTVRGHRTQD